MLPDRVSNQKPLTYESAALPIVLRGPAYRVMEDILLVKRTGKKNMDVCLYTLTTMFAGTV